MTESNIFEKCREPDQNIYRRALNHYGDGRQIGKTAEDLLRLARELIRFYDGRSSRREIKESMADAENMLAQMRVIFDNPPGEIDRVKGNKMDKIKRIMDGDE